MNYFLQAMKAKGFQQDHYSAVRTSEEDASKDGLLEKEPKFAQPRPSFWRRHGYMILVQVILLAIYTVVMYLVAIWIRSQSVHGPTMLSCP